MSFKFSHEKQTFLKRLFHLAFPIMITELISNGTVVITAMIVGSLGVYAITAVSISNQIGFIFILVVFGINSAAVVLMGQFWGKNDIKSIHKTMGICFVSGLFAAFAFACVAIFFPQEVLGFFSTDEKVIALGEKYLSTACLTYFVLALTMTIKFSLRSIGQTRIPVFSTALALFVNAILCYTFVNVLEWGVEGAALALLIARALELAFSIIIVIRMKIPIVTKISNYFTANLAFVKEYFKIAVPVILNETFWAVGTVLYIYSYKFTGTEGQGAYEIAKTMDSLFMVFGMSVGTACGIMLSNTLGSGDTTLAIKYSRYSMVVVAIVSCITAFIMLGVSPYIINTYAVSDVVKSNAMKIVVVMSFGMALKQLNFAMICNILRSGGDVVFCLVVDNMAVWCVGLPLSYIAAKYLGAPVYLVTLVIYSEELFKFILCFHRTLSNKWAKNLVSDMK